MGEIPEWEGLREREGEGEGRESWHERQSARVDTPQPDDGRLVGSTSSRRNREGVMRSGSGSGRSIERAVRKEVRWSKDVDYEG